MDALTNLKCSLWKSFGGSIDMLNNAIELWPTELWDTKKKFFYIAYHTLVFLDYYLTIPPENFKSTLPFTLTDQAEIPEDAIDDVVPDRIYSKEELLTYTHFCREKCHSVIAGLTEDKLQERWIGQSKHLDLALCSQAAMSYSVLDILFYNLRHVQHHSAQLNLLLRQEIDNAPEYVSQAEDSL
ncbi:DinB family protein [Flavihumibacter solisilvae]|uniref:DinB-like domain-containing protein n=1 Tax=Flavihumibacter solisilvae TaxID=1349421 RepID=A0A0C1LG69_9BACT|nr:DinB family protein [Flavihumibacter solisilvae]KIC94353.1 hypothetical protein OI18_12080 [Flavihumibacter solisilvae]